MSKQKQTAARDRRNAAERREENARERAQRNRDRGDPMLARIHERSAEAQRDAANAAQESLDADRLVEGDQLGDEGDQPPAATGGASGP